MGDISGKSCSPNTHFMFNIYYSRRSCRLWDKVEKYCRTRLATDDSI